MTSTTSVLTWLRDPESLDPARAGGKGANLAVLLNAGMPVPDGFVVPTSAYLDFVRHHHLDSLIRDELSCLTAGSQTADDVSRRLRKAFAAAPISDALRAEIADAYRASAMQTVAVRSSATAEDLPDASFAGQQDTVTDVAGVDDLCEAVRRCWSSMWTARAITYRNRHEIAHERIAVAVVVQPMIEAEVAGVLFTADPVSGRRNRVVVEAAAGPGEDVVSGAVTPDRWVVDGCSRDVLSAPDLPVLELSQLTALVALGVRAAELLGGPQDVEWVISGGRCWLLQSRPITSLFPLPSPAAPGLRVYIPALLVAQGITEPLTPAGNAFFQSLIAGWISYLTTGSVVVEASPPRWLPVLAGRVYIDITLLLQYPRLAARLVENFALKEPTGSATLRDWLHGNAGRLARGRRLPVPLKMARCAPAMLARLAVAIAAPARTRRRVIAAVDRELRELEVQAAASTPAAAQLDFVSRVVPLRTCELVVAELPLAYAEQLVRIGAERLVSRWLGDEADMDALRRWLPQDPTVAMGRELARIARDSAATGEEISPGARGIQNFLETYGHRAPDREIDLGLPRLADDPMFVVEMIRAYTRAGTEVFDRFDAGGAAAADAADTLVAAVRHRKGRLRAALLRTVLDRHSELGGMRERPKFDMVRGIALARRILHGLGARLVAADLLAAPDDVFYLDSTELHMAVGGEARDLRTHVMENRHQFARELKRRAIPRVLVSDGEAVYGPGTDDGGSQGDVLIGTAVSPGVCEGVVRILDSPVGAELQEGEVLVASSTDPGWTPLFLLAGAVVMEVGGVISHGAVVAREYGVPAVAGVAHATTRLRSGQRIRVDGNNGTVSLIDGLR